METPSIETRLARTKDSKSFPIAKRLHDAPLIGSVVRAWVRAFQGAPRTLWVSLPPIVAA